MYTHILISTDGSELAQDGINHGLSLAKALGSKVTIVTVTAPFPPRTSTATSAGWVPTKADVERYDADQKEFASEVLTASKDAAKNMGVEATTLQLSDTSPANAIANTARDIDCNLIVMASHGRRGIRRLLLGSQTAEVLATAHIPVLVIR